MDGVYTFDKNLPSLGFLHNRKFVVPLLIDLRQQTQLHKIYSIRMTIDTTNFF